MVEEVIIPAAALKSESERPLQNLPLPPLTLLPTACVYCCVVVVGSVARRGFARSQLAASSSKRREDDGIMVVGLVVCGQRRPEPLAAELTETRSIDPGHQGPAARGECVACCCLWLIATAPRCDRSPPRQAHSPARQLFAASSRDDEARPRPPPPFSPRPALSLPGSSRRPPLRERLSCATASGSLRAPPPKSRSGRVRRGSRKSRTYRPHHGSWTPANPSNKSLANTPQAVGAHFQPAVVVGEALAELQLPYSSFFLVPARASSAKPKEQRERHRRRSHTPSQPCPRLISYSPWMATSTRVSKSPWVRMARDEPDEALEVGENGGEEKR